MDTAMVDRWSGSQPDLTRPLPSDLVLAAGSVAPDIAAGVQPYLAMMQGPASLDPFQSAARALFETGWRPDYADGPTHDELAAVVVAAAA